MNEEQIKPVAAAGRKANNPELLAVGKRLQALEFATPLTEEEITRIRNNITEPKGYAVLYGKTKNYLTLRLSLMGKAVTMATLEGLGIEQRVKAARYADLCRAKFWPYKMRDRRPPVDADLNTSLARVEMDQKNEPAILALLNETERFLLDAGLIKLTSVAANQKERKQQTREELKEINRRLFAITATQQQVLNTLENRLDGLQQVVMGIQKDNSVLIMAVSTILEKLANPPLVGVWSGSNPGCIPPNTCCNSVTEVRSLPSNKYEA
jgi:hypothetical protein